MNSSVPQCKNCWKWEYTAFVCCTNGAKCQKCNQSHKLEYHREMTWCCKANFKINPLRLEIKKGELYTYSFKYINCKGKYQIDSNNCLF